MTHELPKLPYDYDALEPHIDAQTMEIHHSKHHQAYVDNLNKVLEKYPDLAERKLEDLIGDLHDLPMAEEDKKILKNNGGGHLNHSLFWQIMGPEKEVDNQLVKDIESEFGSIDSFKEQFETAAKTHFGSGWAWLVRDDSNKLKVYSLPNQDSPLMHPPHLNGHTPIIGLDVWEHAYYLKYQNKRPDYISAWWNVLKLL